jgi:TolA-binding protein
MKFTQSFLVLSGFSAGLFLFTVLLPGQSTRGGGTANPVGGTTRPTNPGGTTNPNTGTFPTNNPTNMPQTDIQRPLFFSGKVMLSDGYAPTEPVVIERVCNGISHREAYTDNKGRFSFEMGHNAALMADASSSDGGRSGAMGSPSSIQRSGGGSRERDMMGCELKASLPGYRSDVVSLATRRSLDDPDVGTIVLHRMGNVEGTTISATSAMAPKDARKSYEKAVDLLKKNKADEAQTYLEKATTAYPKYASAWMALGNIQEQAGKAEDARHSYQQAIAADGKYIKPYERLYMMAVGEQKWPEAAETSDRVIHLNPLEFPQAYYYNGLANFQMHKLDPAEKSVREAVKIDTQHQNPRALYLLGIIQANKSDLPGAAESLRGYLLLVKDSKEAENARKQLAQVEKELAARADKPAAKDEEKQP